ncbi:MAG: diguanylate cyclase domain-containing protein [Bacteroidota bacterium]
MSALSEPRTGGRGAETSRLEISLGPAALSAFAGAAVVLDRSGAVVAANGRAEVLGAAIAEGRLTHLSSLLSGGRPVVETLAVAGGGSVMLELSALPAADGRVLVLGRDVTLERNLRSALVESRQRYKDLVEISSDFAWEVGADGRFVFVSPKGALGFSPDELVGRSPAEFVVTVGEADGAALFTAGLPVEDAEVWMKLADGGEACVLLSSMPVLGEQGEWRGARGVCRDVTQERLRDAALGRANNRERLLSYIVRTIRDEVEPSDMLRAAAEATARALGATGCQIFRIIPDASDFALAAQYGDGGNEKPVLDNFIASDHFDQDLDGWHTLASVSRYRQSINGAVVLWRDGGRTAWSDDDRLLIDDVANQVGLANEQIANHERILRLSRTDSLTGLFNRRAFFEEIARRFNRLSRERKPAALIYVDLDNFKLVNDVHGHHAGDQALLKVRDLLMQHTRPTDIVARLGGDEFAIWLEGAEESIAVQRCRELLAATDALAAFSGAPERPLHMSLGVAVHAGASQESLDELVARADKAMYEVKRDGKGDWRLAPPPASED